jgi:hypothetical protein
MRPELRFALIRTSADAGCATAIMGDPRMHSEARTRNLFMFVPLSRRAEGMNVAA